MEEIFALPDHYLMDRGDFDKFFPTIDSVQGVRVAGESVAEISALLGEELPAGFSPRTLFVYYIGRDLRMQEIADLDEAFGHPQRWKRGMVLANLPYGRLTVYVFYNEANGFDNPL